MDTLANLKTERISIRTTSEIKKLIITAATLSNVSMTDFLLAAARQAAEQVVAESETLILDNKERDGFLALLDNPPPPSDTLKVAARRHRKHLRL